MDPSSTSRRDGVESVLPIEIVLVRPKRGANVAAAARAMKNMGLARLTLVDSRVPNGEERDQAYGAWDVLDAARRASDLREALERCVFVAATSSRANDDEWSPRRFALESMRRASSGSVAVVFGPEDSGLRNDELRQCHVHVRIPSARAQPSLNLAQAVLVVSYELRMASMMGFSTRGHETATVAELEGCLDALREALLSIGYLNPDNPNAILSELRRLIARVQPSPRDVTLLRGMARQILWMTRRHAAIKNEIATSFEPYRHLSKRHD